jgi:hypothetical protein
VLAGLRADRSVRDVCREHEISTAVPEFVPATVVGSARLDLAGEAWELRPIRVAPEREEPTAWVPFREGLPAR